MTSSILNGVLNTGSVLGTENKVTTAYPAIEQDEEKDFASVLKNAMVNSLNETQRLIDNAESAEIAFAMGESDNTHDLLIAQNKASLAVNYAVAVRDRLLEAYKEIMNMQV